VYEVRPRKDKRGINLISDALPFGRLWYGEPDAISNAVGHAKFRSRSRRAVIRVYDETGNVVEPYVGSNVARPHFGHGAATFATAGRVKCFMCPQVAHFHDNDLCSARCSTFLRTESA